MDLIAVLNFVERIQGKPYSTGLKPLLEFVETFPTEEEPLIIQVPTPIPDKIIEVYIFRREYLPILASNIVPYGLDLILSPPVLVDHNTGKVYDIGRYILEDVGINIVGKTYAFIIRPQFENQSF